MLTAAIAHHPHAVYAAPVSALIRNTGFSDHKKPKLHGRYGKRQSRCQTS